VAGYVGDAGAPLLKALNEAPSAMRATLEMPIDDGVVEALITPAGTPGIIAGAGLDAITADEVAHQTIRGTTTIPQTGSHTIRKSQQQPRHHPPRHRTLEISLLRNWHQALGS